VAGGRVREKAKARDKGRVCLCCESGRTGGQANLQCQHREALECTMHCHPTLLQIWHCNVCNHGINDGSERYIEYAECGEGDCELLAAPCTQRLLLLCCRVVVCCQC